MRQGKTLEDLGRELERQLAAKPNHMSTFIIIAIIAAILGFILAQIIK